VTILAAGAIYFLLVFSAGFILGPIRIMLLVPRLGERWAELLEMPVMLAVIIVAARWVVEHFLLSSDPTARFCMGGLALALLLTAEFSLVLRLRKMTIHDYLETRDPVSGTAYYLMLGVFALMPLFVGRN
jgi:MFS family permease